MNNNIYPSLISADLLNLQREIKLLEPWSAGFHLDVMDFHFVPNLTWGPDFVNAIRKTTPKQLWIDLLVDDPILYLDRFLLANNDIVSVHYESNYDNAIFEEIRIRGWLASLALNPTTPLEVILPFLGSVDHILLMSVNPGFSGQNFVMESVEKLKKLHDIRNKYNLTFSIGMDGGLNQTTLPALLTYGVDTIAVASCIFEHKNPAQELQRLTNLPKG